MIGRTKTGSLKVDIGNGYPVKDAANPIIRIYKYCILDTPRMFTCEDVSKHLLQKQIRNIQATIRMFSTCKYMASSNKSSCF